MIGEFGKSTPTTTSSVSKPSTSSSVCIACVVGVCQTSLLSGFSLSINQSTMQSIYRRIVSTQITHTPPPTHLTMRVKKQTTTHVFFFIRLHFKTFAQLRKLKALSILVNALAAAGDVLIAGILCTILHLSRTGFHRLVGSHNHKHSKLTN